VTAVPTGWPATAPAPAPVAPPVVPETRLGDPALEIRGLAKAFAGRRVLDGVDLTVRAGELVAVLGANGSGKSTMLRCVVGLVAPDAGEIRLLGHDVRHGHEARGDRHGRAAMVFQQIHLVRRRSALANVCCGALGRLPLSRSLTPALFPRDLREEAMACLHRVGLADRAHERVTRLSGGQQQRVAVARALCQRAEVVLADEPISALDPQASVHVLGLLADLAHEDGLAVACVLHQPDLARRHADRLVGLLHGRVVLDAAPDRVTAADLDLLYTPDHLGSP
jgi:phosphonate transport system ATP-binding protein